MVYLTIFLNSIVGDGYSENQIFINISGFMFGLESLPKSGRVGNFIKNISPWTRKDGGAKPQPPQCMWCEGKYVIDSDSSVGWRR